MPFGPEAVPSFEEHQLFVAEIPDTNCPVIPLDHQFGRSRAVMDDVRNGAEAPILIADRIADNRFLTSAVGHILTIREVVSSARESGSTK